MAKQAHWDSAFKQSISKGYKAEDAKLIANISASSYKEPVAGKRSMAMNRSFVETGNVFDILVGYPDSGLEANAVDSLDNSGWETFNSKTVKADLEHFNMDFSSGIPNHLDEKWQHFGVDAELYKQGSEIRARFIVPDTELGSEFKEDYKSGKYGASIEYKGEDNGNKVTNWEITGFSFTKDPHYDKTKPQVGTENQSE